MMLISESCPACRLYFGVNPLAFLQLAKKNQSNIRAAQDGKVGCNTISYMVSFVVGQGKLNPAL